MSVERIIPDRLSLGVVLRCRHFGSHRLPRQFALLKFGFDVCRRVSGLRCVRVPTRVRSLVHLLAISEISVFLFFSFALLLFLRVLFSNDIYCASCVNLAAVSTLAGGFNGTNGGFADGTGSQAGFNNLGFNVAVDADGNVYIADRYNHRLRKVTPVGGAWGWSVCT